MKGGDSMFEYQIKEFYKYLTKKKLRDKFTIIHLKRKSAVQYVTDKYKWILVPLNSMMTKENIETNYKVQNTTHFFFIENLDFGDIANESLCRELAKDDKMLFQEFKESCSSEDKEEGMVSLNDDLIYGMFVNGRIVAVSSLWNWGDVISDVGILVHPKYRKKGYAKAVCQTLMKNINRKFVWRCDEKNIGSYNLAKSIGFTKVGQIQELVEWVSMPNFSK